MSIDLRLGDCLDLMADIPDASVDAVITDPPYPEISRDYGRMTEADWHAMMRGVVAHCRRILKPSGSAVFILQANQEKVGRVRPWLFEFQAWTAREWNMVQDVWWWNFAAPPTVHCHREYGLTRPGLKACVWLGSSDCYRDQTKVLWTQSDSNAAINRSDRALQYFPSGLTMRSGRCASVADDRGGVTPFNLIPISNTNSTDSAGSNGHGAGTPEPLIDWWTRYLVPDDGTVCDPFMGSGTQGIVCVKRGLNFIGIESDPGYFSTVERRIAAESNKTPLFNLIARATNDAQRQDEHYRTKEFAFEAS